MGEHDWIVQDLRDDGAYVCLRCKDRYKPQLPASIDMVLAMMKSFMKIHRRCSLDLRTEALK